MDDDFEYDELDDGENALLFDDDIDVDPFVPRPSPAHCLPRSP